MHLQINRRQLYVYPLAMHGHKTVSFKNKKRQTIYIIFLRLGLFLKFDS